MKKALTLSFCLVVLAIATAQAQVWRGNGRIQGIVSDESGKPVAGAKVTLSHPKSGGSPAALTTDKKGKFAIVQVAGGTWNIDIEAPGFVTKKGTVQVEAFGMTPTVKLTLDREAPPEPAAAPADVASTVAPEAVAAVKAGEQFMAEGKYKEAVAEFEKAQALLPDHIQLKQVLAQAYYKSGQLKEAIALLQAVNKAEPNNTGVLLLLINLLLENGQLEEGKALLDTVPAGTMTDPTALLNIGILFMNREKLTDAQTYFDKAVAIDPNRGESYYYRGIALLQQKKMKEAKADFEKVVSLAPDSTEAKDAKDLLAQMK